MKPGEIVEYIEHHKILCAVILKVEEKKLKLLTIGSREIKLPIERIYHKSNSYLNLASGKIQLIESIKRISLLRDIISKSINVKLIWEKVNHNPRWIDLKTISKLCFSEKPTENEEAAVIRVLFKDKLYFKFKPLMFFPNSEKTIKKLTVELKKIEHHQSLIKTGSKWINFIIEKPNLALFEKNLEIENILSSFYLFGKKSPYFNLANKILSFTNINSSEDLFNFMVSIGVWDTNENLEIIRLKIPTKFKSNVIEKAKKIKPISYNKTNLKQRVDFTKKFTITIDGTNTLDFDDALSIEREGNYNLVGIHISDVAHYINKNNTLDRNANKRICSIYTPDTIIPMLPNNISEDICSLKKDKIKPVISTIVSINDNGNIIGYKIYPAIIKVNEQLNYNTANKAINHCKQINKLYTIAKNLRKLRIKNGATQITIPELEISLDNTKNSNPIIKKFDQESPSRLLVAEMMILSNSLSAKFLNEHKIPAIFRSQPEPRIRIIKNNSTSIFHNWMQKKMLRRLSLTKYAERHCILGVNAYVTATSPIRKYSDLVTQRQIRAALKIDKGYSHYEISVILKNLLDNTSQISKIQTMRQRYWILKYLEKKIGQKEEVIVLEKKRNFYNILMKKYMLELTITESNKINLQPKDIIQVIIQHASARNNVISVFLG